MPPWVSATACPCEPWALPCSGPHARSGGLPPRPVASRTFFPPLLISTSRHLHRKPCCRPTGRGLAGRLKKQTEEAGEAPGGAPPCTQPAFPTAPGTSCPALCPSPPSWFRLKRRLESSTKGPRRATQHPSACQSAD
ncbi:uncharacterized protein LOC120245760 isoform X3 [Hyaena hyaena]|uniref:uncharacterized protein LOC120245760 isoform X3 n=1 Tax=Hyaena hyaena TaxID=95912 RepID=UPI0019238446|nr:uncharacterized protein LOC120245760 isoform X3 [Hyaena hyaena]